MIAKKLPYKEGDAFWLPLREGGFGRGVVARLDGRGIALGYFFGPKLNSSEGAGTEDLKPGRATLIGRFGDLGLLKGKWKVFGRIEPWDRAHWRLPAFLQLDEASGRGVLRYYDDSLKFIREEPVAVSALNQGVPQDGLMGYGAAEIRLTKSLR